MKRTIGLLAIVLVLAVLLPTVAAACPNCTSATSTTEKPGQMGVWRGMYWSILLMVGAPFSLVAAMFVTLRRARRRQLASAPPAPAPLAFPERGDAGVRL